MPVPVVDMKHLPNWQKRGAGVSFRDVRKEGFNPMKQEKVFTVRRETDYSALKTPAIRLFRSTVPRHEVHPSAE